MSRGERYYSTESNVQEPSLETQDLANDPVFKLIQRHLPYYLAQLISPIKRRLPLWGKTFDVLNDPEGWYQILEASAGPKAIRYPGVAALLLSTHLEDLFNRLTTDPEIHRRWVDTLYELNKLRRRINLGRDSLSEEELSSLVERYNRLHEQFLQIELPPLQTQHKP